MEENKITRGGFSISFTEGRVIVSDIGRNLRVDLSELYPLGALIKEACAQESWGWVDAFCTTLYSFLNVPWDATGLLDVVRISHDCADRHKDLYAAPLSDSEDAEVLQDLKTTTQFIEASQEKRTLLDRLRTLFHLTKKNKS